MNVRERGKKHTQCIFASLPTQPSIVILATTRIRSDAGQASMTKMKKF